MIFIFLQNILYFFLKKFKFESFYTKIILFLVNFPIFLVSCSSEVKIQIFKSPVHKIQNIFFIEIGNFEFVEGEIFTPSFSEQDSGKKFSKSFKLLKPTVEKFVSKKNIKLKIIDLVKANILHELSLNSPYKLYLQRDNKLGFSGIIPDTEKVAILNARVKFFQEKIESKEELSYFTNIKNKGVNLEQAILSRTIAMGAENSGLGYRISTPYVEHFAAIEVEFSLLKKSDRSNIIPKKTISSFYAKKWGGNPNSSHLKRKTRFSIIRNFYKEKEINKTFLSLANQAGLSILEPKEYFARGFNLKSSPLVPKTSLEIQINLAQQVAKNFLKLISPYYESSNLVLKNGNKIAKTLIAGNAFLEAISFLQGIDNREPEDDYNLGLSYEAIGDKKNANSYYKSALSKDPGEILYRQAINRTN